MIHTEKTDIWALGVTFFYILTGQTPFDDAKSIFELQDYVMNRPINFDLIRNDEPRHLISAMLEKDPERRASLDFIIASDWLTRKGQEVLDFTVEVSRLELD